MDRRTLLLSGVGGAAALLSGSSANTFAEAAHSENAPDLSGGGTLVKLMPDDSADRELGDSGQWNLNVEGVEVSVDKDQLSAYAWHDGRWCQIDAVTENDGRFVVWYDTRNPEQSKGPYLNPKELGCQWADEVPCALFAV